MSASISEEKVVYRDWKPKVRTLLAFVMTKINDQGRHEVIIAKKA